MSDAMNEDLFFMNEAIKEAEKAFNLFEVPVGAVLVQNGKIVGRGYNQKETKKDATLHGELIAIKEACKHLGGWRLPNCTMYVTLEPCSMCAGAIINARIDRLVIGVKDEKTGACGSVFNIVQNDKLNHQTEIFFGICEEECRSILQKFFIKLREKNAVRKNKTSFYNKIT